MTFGEFARLKRIKSGKTQQACAEAIGMKTNGGYSHLETGRRNWHFHHVENFAKLMGMKTSKLLVEYEKKNS